MILKHKWQELSDDFYTNYNDRGCSCFINAPCSWCTHPGNPHNLENTDDAWEPDAVELEQIKKLEHHKAYDRAKRFS